MNKKQKKSNGVPERDSKGRLFVNLMEDSGFKAVFADKDNKNKYKQLEIIQQMIPPATVVATMWSASDTNFLCGNRKLFRLQQLSQQRCYTSESIINSSKKK